MAPLKRLWDLWLSSVPLYDFHIWNDMAPLKLGNASWSRMLPCIFPYLKWYGPIEALINNILHPIGWYIHISISEMIWPHWSSSATAQNRPRSSISISEMIWPHWSTNSNPQGNLSQRIISISEMIWPHWSLTACEYVNLMLLYFHIWNDMAPLKRIVDFKRHHIMRISISEMIWPHWSMTPPKSVTSWYEHFHIWNDMAPLKQVQGTGAILRVRDYFHIWNDMAPLKLQYLEGIEQARNNFHIWNDMAPLKLNYELWRRAPRSQFPYLKWYGPIEAPRSRLTTPEM